MEGRVGRVRDEWRGDKRVEGEIARDGWKEMPGKYVEIDRGTRERNKTKEENELENDNSHNGRKLK